jgi:hypothetical protein
LPAQPFDIAPSLADLGLKSFDMLLFAPNLPLQRFSVSHLRLLSLADQPGADDKTVQVDKAAANNTQVDAAHT